MNLRSLSLSFFLVMSAGIIISLLAQENPIEVFLILINGAFGGVSNFTYTIYYSTPVLFSGLSVAWALRAGMFNIGAEGQMLMAGVGIVATSAGFASIPSLVAAPTTLVACALFGGIWGALAGALKAYRGVHEVLATILLNFVSYGFCSYAINILLKDPTSPMPETIELPQSFWFMSFDSWGSPINIVSLIGVFAAVLYGVMDRRSLLGYRQRLVGEAQSLARHTGTPVRSQMVWAMMISGSLAGLGAMNEVSGYVHRARDGFTAGAGFVGIAVALLGRGRWWGILLASILFGAIHKGSLDLDIDSTHMTRDFALVLQGIIVLVLCAQPAIEKRLDHARNQ